MGLLDRILGRPTLDEIREYHVADAERIEEATPASEGIYEKMPELSMLGQQFLQTMENVGEDYLPSNQELYDYIAEALKDPDIETQLDNFYSLVESSRLEIQDANDSPEAKRIGDIVRDIIDEDVIKDFVEKSIRCVEQGFSVVWTQFFEDGTYPYAIEEFTEPNYTYFDFNKDGYLVDKYTLKVYDEPNWIITTFREKWGDRHGRSILLSLYWTLKFQKLTYKECVVLLDKLGVPSFAALIKPSGTDADDKKRANNIAGVLRSIKSHSGIALTADQITKLEAQSGALTEMMDFIKYLSDIKTTTIMGTLLASGTATNSGTYNLAENHAEITNQRAEKVADLLAKSLTKQVIPLLVRLNVGVNVNVQNYPVAKFIFDRNASLDDLLKVGDKVEGVEVKAETLKKTYNLPIENDDEEVLSFSSGNTLSNAEFSNNSADLFFFQKLRERMQRKQMKSTQKNQTS